MLALRHVLYFVALGLFWGISPSLYKYWGESGVPVSHVICYTGLGLALFLFLMSRLKEGLWNVSGPLFRYGLVCAVLMNVPFAWSLTLARHVPAPELAIVFSVSPIVSFIVGAATGRDPFTARRVLAIAFGFAASTILVLTREGMVSGQVSWWLVAAFINPLLWASYNWYAQTNWPKEGTTFSVGAAESLLSGLLALPFVLVMAPPWATGYSGTSAWWSLVFATAMWLAERISFFTLIRERGASYTSQAVYLSTPAAVFIAMYFFGGAGDVWLWFSLALLMVALYLNNSGQPVRRDAILQSS
ncbi:MAG: DMT family transporter [Rhizobiales bacterium]|nr:DMT family transporter [Hyphomicrobiales bacterium]